MSLTPQLLELKALERDYQAAEATKAKLAGKVLTTLIAPTAVGKSTIIEHVLNLAGNDFSLAYSITTRARRRDDPTEYKTASEGYTIDRITSMIQNRELTHYVVNPWGHIYCSLPESFPAHYNLLPCVPDILGVVGRAGFSAVHNVYIVTSVQDWAERLPARQGDPTYTSRLLEAVESLSWAIEHADQLVFVENASGQVDQAAQTILNVSRGQASDANHDRGVTLAIDMLAFAKNELARLNTS